VLVFVLTETEKLEGYLEGADPWNCHLQ